jgi:hypothetical protein
MLLDLTYFKQALKATTTTGERDYASCLSTIKISIGRVDVLKNGIEYLEEYS